MKCCTACGEWKPLDEFHLDAHRTDGRMFQCKTCRSILRKASYQRNRHKVIAQQRVYRQRIRDSMTPSENREYNFKKKLHRIASENRKAEQNGL